MNTPRAIWDRRDLLRNLVSRNLKSRYKDSGLGFLWSVLAPLLMALVYLVFLRILARGVPMTEVLIGVFAWQFTAQCVGNGLGAITENSNLVTKVAFPRIILPLASAAAYVLTDSPSFSRAQVRRSGFTSHTAVSRALGTSPALR